MVRFLTQVEVLKTDLSSTSKVREDECSGIMSKITINDMHRLLAKGTLEMAV